MSSELTKPLTPQQVDTYSNIVRNSLGDPFTSIVRAEEALDYLLADREALKEELRLTDWAAAESYAIVLDLEVKLERVTKERDKAVWALMKVWNVSSEALKGPEGVQGVGPCPIGPDLATLGRMETIERYEKVLKLIAENDCEQRFVEPDNCINHNYEPCHTCAARQALLG